MIKSLVSIYLRYQKTTPPRTLKKSHIILIEMETGNLYYERHGIRYYIGDKVSGNFQFGETEGIIKFGEFDAFWPNGKWESSDSFGIYVLTDKHAYSIVQIVNLKKIS